MPTGNVCFGGELDGWRQPGLKTCQRNAILGKQQVTQSLAICPGATGCLQIFFSWVCVCVVFREGESCLFFFFFFPGKQNLSSLGAGELQNGVSERHLLQEYPAVCSAVYW